jgi:hypothetical protein
MAFVHPSEFDMNGLAILDSTIATTVTHMDAAFGHMEG